MMDGNTMNKLLTSIVGLLLLVALTGCGGPTAASGTQGTANTAGQEPTSDQANTGATVTDDRKALEKFLESKSTSTYQVTYDIVASMKDVGDSTSTMGLYMDGETRVRTDISTQGMVARTYMIANVLTTCTQSNSKWTCMKLDTPPTDETKEFEQSILEEKDAADSDYQIKRDGTKVVAGVTADCFAVTSKDATVGYCFSKEGVPLYMKTQFAEGTSEMTATSYTTKIAADTFKLPAEPTTLKLSADSPEGAAVNACASCDMLPADQQAECKAAVC